METWGGAVAPGPTGKSGEVSSGWVCGSEAKERSQGKSERGSQEEESCRREEEEEENARVSITVTSHMIHKRR